MKTNFCITYYDFADLNYLSFFLVGFFENSKKYNYNFKTSKATPEILLELGRHLEWDNILFSIGLFRVETKNDSFYFCIDTRDSNSSDINAGKGYHLPLLDKVKYYFKVNYNKDIVFNDTKLNLSANKIIPVLPFLPIKFNKLSLYLPRLLPSKITEWNFSEVEKRIKFFLKNPTLEEMIKFRNTPKEYDIFFLITYYDGAIHHAENEFRYKLIKEIRKLKHLNTYSGLTGKNLPGKFHELEVDGLRIKQYLGEVAKAKVAIYIRGMLDCLSFKFSQYLAMGLPIIGQKIRNNTENIMKYKYFDIQFAYDDPIEIVNRAVETLKQPDLLAELGKSNADVFDKNFTPQTAVNEILEQIIKN